MTSHFVIQAVTAISVLVILSMFVFKISRARFDQICQRLLAGRDPDSLDEIALGELEAEAHKEHHRTIYRKLDILSIAFQLPGLASWGMITGRNSTPPLYCIVASFVFWLAVTLLVGYSTT